MSTNLQLCNALIKKVGISGGPLTTVVGQAGELGRVVNWIDDAFLNIQLVEQRWNWMRATLSFVTTAAQSTYTATQAGLTDFANWKIDSFRCYITSVGANSEQFLVPMKYDAWRDVYLFGSMRTSYGLPTMISEGPDLTLNLGLIPDSVGYTVVGEYFKTPTSLVLDADTPALPAQYHQMIVYRAMMMYASYEAAPEVYQEGQTLYSAMLKRLLRDQIEDASYGNALA